MTIEIIHKKDDLRNAISKLKQQGKTIGFTPTMGALHEGHISLVNIAKTKADIVVLSIFVNPTQFGKGEDFDKYPRILEEDINKLKGTGVDLVYVPAKEEIYPDGFDMKISTGKIGQELEGVTRPHFFDGVALVVTKLFMQVQPDIAVFGQKDFQQLHVIEKLVSNLDMPIKIIGADIIREDDGLAMSSRNAYLPEGERKIATNLYATMKKMALRVKKGEPFEEAINWGKNELLDKGFMKVDYLEIRDPKTLKKTNTLPARLLVAAYLGGVRLIDNMEIS